MWTVIIGDGKSDYTNGLISIPQKMFYNIKPNTATNTTRNLYEILLQDNFSRPKSNIHYLRWLNGRIILAPTNREVDALNDMIQNLIPVNNINLTSADSLEDFRDIMHIEMSIPH